MTNDSGAQLAWPRLQTLGHYRRSKWMPFVAGATIDVWMPCWRTWSHAMNFEFGSTKSGLVGFATEFTFRDERGKLVPHVYYKFTMGAGCGSISCPPCRVAMAKRRIERYGGVLTTCDACGYDHRDVQRPGDVGVSTKKKPVPTQMSLF